MSRINVRDFFNENEDGAPDLVGITTFSATSYFVPTRGTTAQRPSEHVKVGSLRYNYDIKNLEYYRGETIGWAQFELIDPDLGDVIAGQSVGGVGTRGLFAGGYTATPAVRNIIEFITIATMGNSQDFGDLTAVRRFAGATSSTTRGVFIAGYNPSMTNTIDYVNIQTTGNAVDFGDTINKTQSSACSNGHGGLG